MFIKFILTSMRSLCFLVAVSGLIVSGLAGCGGHAKPEYLAATPKDSSIQSYITDTVRLERAASDLVLNGRIAYDQDSVTPVFPFVSGAVETVPVGLGDYVRRGQVLATVRSGDVADRETNHNQAKTDAEQAQRAFDNANVQFTNGFGSAADLAAARSALERAKAELYRTEEQLKLYSNPNDKNQHTFFTVRAPLSGYIVERHINVGTQIRADNASPLFVISSLKRVWAYANIYEQDVRKVHVGLGASVEVLSYPGKEYLGHVDRLATALDEQSRVLQARINLPNPKGELRPEMFATIRMHLDGDTARRLSLPSRSVIFSNNHYYVVAGGHPKNFRLVRVEVIKNSANRSFVAAGHLAPGDTVLTDGNLTVFADLKKD